MLRLVATIDGSVSRDHVTYLFAVVEDLDGVLQAVGVLVLDPAVRRQVHGRLAADERHHGRHLILGVSALTHSVAHYSGLQRVKIGNVIATG